MSSNGKTSAVFLKGLIDTLPLILAAAPFAVIYGALAIGNGLSVAATLGISILVFAGASQFVAATLVGLSAPLLVIIATVFIVNLRHMLYSLSVMSRIKNLNPWLRIPMAFWMTDESFAVISRQLETQKKDYNLYSYFWGSAIGMYLNWIFFTVVGIVLGQSIPNMTEWGLDMAMVMAFIAIVVPQLKSKAHLACALTAIAAAVLTYDWPYKLGLLLSSLLAIAVGFFLSKLGARQ